jgi:hypothetical protein
MRTANRRYLVELTTVLVAYALMLVLSLFLLRAFPQGALRIPIALAPMLPACGIPFVVVRGLQRCDELQRQIQLEALGFAFGGTAVLTFGYGFLQGIGFPQVSWLFVWPVMAVVWLIGVAWASRRYR